MERTVHLIDASPYIFRAYFSLPSSIKDREGNPVNGVHGFASFLLKLVADEHPTHLGVAFDRSLTTSFRNKVYPAYKAQRDLPPPELEAQLDACEKVAAALGAAVYVDDEYEADDLIATLCGQLAVEGYGAVVVSSDKDLAQLVDERTTLFDFGKGERLTAAEVSLKFGVRPDQVADLLGLAGDPVDNIPGIAGIGRKTAAALLAIFGHVEELYERLDEVNASTTLRGAKTLAARLAAGRDIAFLSKSLATVARDAPVRADLAELTYRGPDLAAVDPLFERLGFKTMRERVRALGEG